MKMKSTFKTICGLVSCVLVSLVMVSETIADGTDQLGPPSISIAPGSYVLVEGTGLIEAQPSDIAMEIPIDVNIAQVLLYWTGRDGDDDAIEVNGTNVMGSLIGGTADEAAANTYRADITELSSAEGWLVAGQTNVLSVGGLDFTKENNGAAVVAILDDGSTVDIAIMDGTDLAYLPWGVQTAPVDIPVAPSAYSQTGTLNLIVSDVESPRPNALEITMGGVTTSYTNVFLSNAGNDLDVVTLEVPVPAGTSNVTVQALSINDGSGLQPSSLYWHFVSWVIPEPYIPSEGCTYTIGYWKNHPYDWPVEDLSIYTGHEAMLILWTPPKKGNAYLILAHQYIAAELNALNGTSVPDVVNTAWLDAQEILLQYKDEGTIPKKSEDRDLAIDLASILDDYNNGLIGPGHCD